MLSCETFDLKNTGFYLLGVYLLRASLMPSKCSVKYEQNRNGNLKGQMKGKTEVPFTFPSSRNDQ